MTASPCVPKSFRLLSGLVLTAALSSCLGVSKLPDEPSRFELQACADAPSLSRESDKTAWQLRFIGPAQPLATAKAPWGSTLRYVYPYTRHTLLFELKVTNRSEQVLWVDPVSIAIERDGRPQPPLELAFFEKAWPAGAVAGESQLIDRSLALSEVIRTLFVRRPLQPGETYTGILPFVRFEDPPAALKIQAWKRGSESLGTDFCLNWRAKPGV